MKKTIIISVLSSLMTCAASASSINLLSQNRPLIQFEQYTAQEKQRVANQAYILLKDLYVHRHQKDLYYGTSPNPDGHISPVKAMEKLLGELDQLSTAQMHQRIQQIFLSQRDLHLNYIYPNSYANFASFLPFRLARVTDGDNAFQVRISEVWHGTYQFYLPDAQRPSLGDTIISYNGKPVKEAIEQFLPTAGGANTYGGFVRGIDHLRYRSHRSASVPVNDKVTFEMLSAQTGEKYTLTVPWLSWAADLPAVQSVETSKKANEKVDQKIDVLAGTEQSSNLEFARAQQLAQLMGEGDFGALNTNATADNTISWSTMQYGDKNLGYIRLSSFEPATSVNQAMWVIMRLLDDQLSDTDALVIDVRDNPGGYITYADRLFQLFSSEQVGVSALRFLNTELNNDMLNYSPLRNWGDNWVKLIQDVNGTDATYSQSSSYLTPDQANFFGQAYYKPVGVLSNARSYSSADLFTCGMQDNGLAKVYGQDPQTGAGGANVITHSLFVEQVGYPFEALPQGQEMRVSWRQAVRFKHHQNELIEDFGCYADVDASRTPKDLKDGGQDQLRKIAMDLFSQPVSKSAVHLAPEIGRLVNLNTSERAFSVNVTNTAKVQLFVAGEAVVSKTVHAYGATPKAVSFELPKSISGKGWVRVQLKGLDEGNATLWNTVRFVNMTE